MIAISVPGIDTFIDGNTTNALGAAEGEYSTSVEDELDGWKWQGGTTPSESGNFGDSLCYGRVWDGQTNAWTITWDGGNRSTGVILAFRPSSPITGWEKTANLRQTTFDTASGLTNTISSSGANAAIAAGPRLYLYLLSGKPTGSAVQNPTPTFPADQTWEYYDGASESNGQMDFAYRLADEGEDFDSTTITTTSGSEQSAHLYCFTMTT